MEEGKRRPFYSDNGEISGPLHLICRRPEDLVRPESAGGFAYRIISPENFFASRMSLSSGITRYAHRPSLKDGLNAFQSDYFSKRLLSIQAVF
jgi:hypothetical protein